MKEHTLAADECESRALILWIENLARGISELVPFLSSSSSWALAREQGAAPPRDEMFHVDLSAPSRPRSGRTGQRDTVPARSSFAPARGPWSVDGRCVSRRISARLEPRRKGYRRHLAITVYLSCELQASTQRRKLRPLRRLGRHRDQRGNVATVAAIGKLHRQRPTQVDAAQGSRSPGWCVSA